MKRKRGIAVVVLCSLILTMFCSSISAADVYATREYTVHEFIESVGKNNLPDKYVDISDFADAEDVSLDYYDSVSLAVGMGYLKGYAEDNTLRPQANIIRVEALAVLSRMLPEAPVVNPDATFDDIPDWATEDILRLARAGIVLGYGDGTFGAQDLITVEQVGLLADRINAQVDAVRLQDDFYDAVNSRFLKNRSPQDGRLTASVMSDMSDEATYQLMDIMMEYILSTEPQLYGSDGQMISDFFYNMYDMEKRNYEALTTIKPITDLLDRAETVIDLLGVMAGMEVVCGSNPIHYFYVSTDQMDTSKYILHYSAGDIGLSRAEMVAGEKTEISQAYIKYLKQLLMLYGYDEKTAHQKAVNVFRMQEDWAETSLDMNKVNCADTYNAISYREFQQLMGNGAIDAFLRSIGFEGMSIDNVVVPDVELVKKVNTYLTKENFEVLKDYCLVMLLRDSAPYLSEEFVEADNTFYNERFGVEREMDAFSDAVNSTQSFLGWPLGRLYVERHFSQRAKDEAEKLVEDIIGAYEERLSGLDWLGDATKAKAIEKLEAIDIKVGYPDQWPEYADDVQIDGATGTALWNVWSLASASNQANFALLDQPVDNSAWEMYPQTVNAYYNVAANEIVFPAAILQAPLFDLDAPEESNLGGIGTVIAHEISHAFDDNGAQYDKNGNLNNWWTAEDKAEYEKRCQRLEEHFDEVEVLPGHFIDGKATLGENIADLSGLACVLDIARGIENADLSLLFRQYASIWAETIEDSYMVYLLADDVHAPSKQRVNLIVHHFPEFYDCFQVTEGDGMFLEPEKRITIW